MMFPLVVRFRSATADVSVDVTERTLSDCLSDGFLIGLVVEKIQISAWEDEEKRVEVWASPINRKVWVEVILLGQPE